MTFRLERQPAGKQLTKFFVYDDKDSIVGTINVPNEAVSDLQKHWKDVAPSSPKNAASATKQDPAVKAMLKASKERGPISRQAVLRGC